MRAGSPTAARREGEAGGRGSLPNEAGESNAGDDSHGDEGNEGKGEPAARGRGLLGEGEEEGEAGGGVEQEGGRGVHEGSEGEGEAGARWRRGVPSAPPAAGRSVPARR